MDNHFLILDIETVSAEKSYDLLTPAMQALWDKKAARLKNDDMLSPEELYFDRGAIYAEFGKIVTIAFGFFHADGPETYLRVKSIAAHDERKLLSDFANIIEHKFDPSQLTLCAHNGKEFDFPYISRRMLINGLPLPMALRIQGKKPWEIRHVDTMELWKFGDWKSYTSLELLTTVFDIPSSKDDIDGSMVNHTYYNENGLDRISRYCCNDVIATAQLYRRMNGLPLIPENQITILDS